MLQQIDKILDEVAMQFTESGEESLYIKKMLDVMEYEVPYTSYELMKMLGLKSKEGFRRNYLRPALNLKLVRMAIPDKPSSKNQRYIKV